MSREYTRQLSARQMIEYIAKDYLEFSYDKIVWQRDDWRKACQDWLEHNPEETMVATIWSKENCVWCDRAKDLLTKESIPYIEKKIGVNVTKEELLEAVPNARSVPQIFIDGVLVGGYDSLYAKIYPQNGENSGHGGEY